jgi:peptidoglycan/xylan/chitin deacetylase (PgdA/CDA1 family)
MTSGPAASRAVALTFDDGPHPVHTPAVLDALRALDLRATFLLVGARAEAHPGLVARIVAEGHAVGHHSWSHTPPHETSAAALLGEARRTSALLERLTGTAPRVFRPPCGKLTPGKLLGLWALGQAVLLWNRDPKDFAQSSPEPIRRFFEAAPLAGGDIVLLHDVHPHAAPALEAIARGARAADLRFTTVAEWIGG